MAISKLDVLISSTSTESPVLMLIVVRYHQRGCKGLLLIGIGIVLCVAGFLVVITQQTGPAFNFALYVMTGIGATCIISGLALIMG
jgi:hypothetical protein